MDQRHEVHSMFGIGAELARFGVKLPNPGFDPTRDVGVGEDLIDKLPVINIDKSLVC